jgi:predicted permease
MSLWRHLTRGLAVLVRRDRADGDLDDELRHYVDEATDAYVARGLPPAAARRQALAEVGSPTRVREHVRDSGWEAWVASWLTDARLAGRTLAKTPIFTAVVVLVVAIGSGAVATVFSALNAIVLRPIPGVADPGSLVALQPARRDGETTEQVSFARYAYLRDRARTLDGIAGWGRVSCTLSTAGGGGTAVIGNLVTASYFGVLGVRPQRGRFFTPGEVARPGDAALVVVSDAYWRTALGADRDVVGRRITVNGYPFTLIGVAPPEFRGLYTGLLVDAWMPITMQPVLRPRSDLEDSTWIWALGRRRPGIGRDATAAELSALVAAHRRESGVPDTPESYVQMRTPALTGLPGGSGPIVAFMSVLLAAAGLVLVIAGINVGALLSARYVERGRDLAVRAALGAGRLRLIRQLLTEVAVLFGLGALGGFVVTTIATSALEQLPIPATVPVTLEISPDLRVLLVAVGVSLAAGLMFGLGPALQGARRDLTTRLKADGARGGVRRSRLGRAMVAGQLALSLMLLVAAGLFSRAVERGARIDPGFDPTGITTALFEPESWGSSAEGSAGFFDALRTRLEAAPTVTGVAYAGRLPLMFGTSEDTIVTAAGERRVHYTAIDGHYFDVMRLPLLRGRGVLTRDFTGGPRIAVVNETLARQLAPDGDALGRTFEFRGIETEVVGVARDAKYAALDEATPPFLYIPLAQDPQPRRALLVRSRGDAALTRTITSAVHAIDPRLPAPRLSTLEHETRIVLLPQRAAAIVMGALGGVGLVLAALGLYGTMAGATARRTREIGLRLALGAERGQVLRGIVGEGTRLALAGVAVGLCLSALAMPLAASWLFGVSPLDGTTYAAMAAGLLLVAGVASYVPARRAAAVDPLVALRTD